jgi:oligoendopeptidase F
LDGIYHEELDNMFHGSVTMPRSFDSKCSAIHHIFLYPFYVYACNFVQCIVVALYRKYLEEVDTFKTFCFDLLTSGGNGSPQELLAQAGIDLADRGF